MSVAAVTVADLKPTGRDSSAISPKESPADSVAICVPSISTVARPSTITNAWRAGVPCCARTAPASTA